MRKTLFRHKLIAGLFFLSLLIVLAGTFWAYAALRGLRAPLVIGFNSGFGIELGSLNNLLAVGATAFILVLINFVVALELDARDRFLGKLVAAVTVVLAFLLFIGFAAIISVN